MDYSLLSADDVNIGILETEAFQKEGGSISWFNYDRRTILGLSLW
jgi:hypothetical protein